MLLVLVQHDFNQRDQMESPAFDIVTTRNGVTSIRDNDTGEIMHNPVGPWIEANLLYIEQSSLKQRLTKNLELGELIIFDVGLGAAANALATLHCARELKIRRPIRLISFERNLELLRFALLHADHFEHFKGYELAIETLLNEGVWNEDGFTWELRFGNYLELIQKEVNRAQMVFYDPYSSKKNTEMWTIDAFKRTYEKCSHSLEDGGVLFTYSRATPVRVGMFLAGFFVGNGTATGAKEETTQAAVHLKSLLFPLGHRWLSRWSKSSQQNATGAPDNQLESTKTFIISHPQFSETLKA